VIGQTVTTDGETVCTDGSITLQNCNAKVTEVDICAEIEAVDNEGNEYEVNVCGLDVAESTNAARSCSPAIVEDRCTTIPTARPAASSPTA
jgi:hypothetical protein